MKKWPKGSAGEAEQKQALIMCAVFGAISILVMLILFVFNNQLHDHVKVASPALKVIGGLMVAGSAGIVAYGAFGSADTKSFGKWWAVLLAGGIFVAAGFFNTLY